MALHYDASTSKIVAFKYTIVYLTLMKTTVNSISAVYIANIISKLIVRHDLCPIMKLIQL